MMNVQDFMASMLQDGFGAGMPGSGQQKGKITDKSFQEMMERMGMWMMMAPGMVPQEGQNQGDAVPDGMASLQGTGMATALDFLNGGGEMPEGWNPYQEAGTADQTDQSLFMEKMALLGRQNRVVMADDGAQEATGENLELQTAKEGKAAGIDLSGWQLPEEGAENPADTVLPKESALPQMAQPEPEDGRAVLPLNDGGASSKTQEQTTGKSDQNANTDALSGTLADNSVPSVPKFRTAEAQTEVPVYHHQVDHEEALGKDMSKLISRQIRAGTKEFEIQLEPQNLGKITIKVSSHDNQTTIAMLCSEEKTLSLLAQNAKELGVIMENNLGTPAQILVDKQAPDYLNQENNQRENQQKEQQKEKQRERKPSGDEDFIQKLRLGMMSVS